MTSSLSIGFFHPYLTRSSSSFQFPNTHRLCYRFCRLKLIWADGGYPSIIDAVRQRFGWTLQIVKRSDDVKGFQVLPHRWVVERTFGWLGRYRRLARDYEHTTLSSESMVYIASTRRMLKMLAT